MKVTTLGIDLAKSVFQLHVVDARGVVMLRKQLRRKQVLPFLTRLSPCLVGMEACAGSHYRAREIAKLGHQCRKTALTQPIRGRSMLETHPRLRRAVSQMMANRSDRHFPNLCAKPALEAADVMR